jgi:hypothetical protein
VNKYDRPDVEAIENARLGDVLLDQTETWNRLADALPNNMVPLLDNVFIELGRTRLMLDHVKRINGKVYKRPRNPFDPSD